MNTEEIKLLQAQNEALKKQCNSLQQEVKQWKYEYEMLDACIELEQGKIAKLQEKIKTIKTSRKIWEAEALKQGCIKVVEADKYKQTLQEIKKVHQWILDQWELDTKEVQDRILDLITKVESEG